MRLNRSFTLFQEPNRALFPISFLLILAFFMKFCFLSTYFFFRLLPSFFPSTLIFIFTLAAFKSPIPTYNMIKPSQVILHYLFNNWCHSYTKINLLIVLPNYSIHPIKYYNFCSNYPL